MTSINDLLGKKKQPEQKEEKPNFEGASKTQMSKNKPSGLALKFGEKKNEHAKDIEKTLLLPKKESKTLGISLPTSKPSASEPVDPFASLGNVLDSISFDNISEKEFKTQYEQRPEPTQQFQNPTLSDVEKFVFEEQPDHSTQEITDIFSSMLDELSLATGDQVPTNVSRCLKFIKEHSFLADILKPEAIGVLVNGLRRSYGFIVKAKTEKGEKKKARDQKVSAVLDSLSDLSF